MVRFYFNRVARARLVSAQRRQEPTSHLGVREERVACSSDSMPRKEQTELSDEQVRKLMERAQARVDRDFCAKEHLPPRIYEWLMPITVSTCQGFYAVTMMVLGTMAALTNGAAVQLWSQRKTPLVSVIFQVGKPQEGKSRLCSVAEEIFDSCDDVIGEMAQKLVDEATRGESQGAPADASAASSATVDAEQLENMLAAPEQARLGPEVAAEATAGMAAPAAGHNGAAPTPGLPARGPARTKREAKKGALSAAVKSISLESFTFPEFFYRCSTSFPQVEFEGGDEKSLGELASRNRLWFGNACNLDEAYEFLDGLGLLAASKPDKENGPGLHASRLNAFIQAGKTRRATRTSTNFGESRAQTVSASILGNGHPTKFIPIDRGMVGNHIAATKERFLVCLDVAVPRHAALPDDLQLPDGVDSVTWLPLTPQQAAVFGWGDFLDRPRALHALRFEDGSQPEEHVKGHQVYMGPSAGYDVELPDGVPSRLRFRKIQSSNMGDDMCRTEFRISSRWCLPDITSHVCCGARRAAEFFAERPHSVLPLDEEGRRILLGNQVAQSIRAQSYVDDILTAALHANASSHQGILAALIAVLDLAAGGGEFDDKGDLKVTAEHIQCAWRLVEVNLGIREAWRSDPDDLCEPEARREGEGHGGHQASVPVSGQYADDRFRAPDPTQASPRPPSVPAVEAGPGHIPCARGDEWSASAFEEEPEDVMGVMEASAPLTLREFPAEDAFDSTGFGGNGAQIFPQTSGTQLFKDKVLLRRLLLSGKATALVAQLVDAYTVCVPTSGDNSGGRNKKAQRMHPKRFQIIAVFDAAFQKFPRLGCWTSEAKTEVALKSWPASERGRIAFHNDLMNCARVTLYDVSVKRALFFDGRPQIVPAVTAGPPAAQRVVETMAAAGHESTVTPVRVAQPVTPPCGFPAGGDDGAAPLR